MRYHNVCLKLHGSTCCYCTPSLRACIKELWINILLWIFNFLGSWCRRRITLTLFLRFKCSNGKTGSQKSGIQNFVEEGVDCWGRVWIGVLQFHWNLPSWWHTSKTCCCSQINFWFLIEKIKSWGNQTWEKKNIFSPFDISPFLRWILRTACKYLAFQIVLWNKQ